jgi:hypothetical protein
MGLLLTPCRTPPSLHHITHIIGWSMPIQQNGRTQLFLQNFLHNRSLTSIVTVVADVPHVQLLLVLLRMTHPYFFFLDGIGSKVYMYHLDSPVE